MKVTNWRRKIAASLVAGGMMLPVASRAASLDTNLVVDPGFEDINATTTDYDNRQLNSWSDGSLSGYTYAAGQYDLGGPLVLPLSDGGARYFSANGGVDVGGPGQVSQNIDVSTGATGALIAGGGAAVDLSSFMTSYAGSDTAFLHVEFLDGASASLGSVQISDADLSTWTLNSGGGLIPTATDTLVVSVFGIAGAGGPDGYQDNVDVRITDAASVLMFLEVNTTTGVGTLKNQTGEAIHIDYYEITSAGNSLDPADGTGWSSFEDQNMAGFPSGDGSGNGWEEAGGSDDGVLSESYLTGNSEVADQAAIGLGALYDPGDPQDLQFSYSVVTGGSAPDGDYNGDNIVNAADYTIWRDTLGSTADLRADGDGSGTIDAGDYTVWKGDFGATGGPTGPGALTTGFVRYVSSGSLQTANVPEPSTVVLVSLGFTGLIAAARRQK